MSIKKAFDAAFIAYCKATGLNPETSVITYEALSQAIEAYEAVKLSEKSASQMSNEEYQKADKWIWDNTQKLSGQPDELIKLKAAVVYVIERMKHALCYTEKENEAAWLDDLLDQLEGAMEITSELNKTQQPVDCAAAARVTLGNFLEGKNLEAAIAMLQPLFRNPEQPVAVEIKNDRVCVEGKWFYAKQEVEQPVDCTCFDTWCASVKDCGYKVQPNSATARQRRLGWDAATAAMNKQESVWQPFTTAPKNGDDIELYVEHGRHSFQIIGHWSDEQEVFVDWSEEPIVCEGYNKFTHWKPKSLPPIDIEGGVK